VQSVEGEMGRSITATPPWLIPILYAAASVGCSLVPPRFENAYLPSNEFGVSVSSAQAFLSATASGMIALTGIVFAIAFVMVQFSAIAYSPRLALWFARDQVLFHSLGIFVATFIYSLATLAWVDRNGSGTVPMLSVLMVAVLLIVSMLLFSWLIQRLRDLQIVNVLQQIGDKGRLVIHEMFLRLDERPDLEWKGGSGALDEVGLAPVTQTVKYSGEPRAIAKFDIEALVRQARQAQAIIVMTCAVGDTLVDDTLMLRVHGAKTSLSERELMGAIDLARERTFEQDPKYPIRLLVDIAIKALSPAINDPTTAVQAMDQIEDLLRRLGRRDLDAGHARDSDGVFRLIFPMPTWEDYLALAFDEIRQFGATSVQVMRRLRSALAGLMESTTIPARSEAAQRYIKHLDLAIDHSMLDAQDQTMARHEDRQGLGLSRKRAQI
jgi:uncharacterized membrane protein